MLEFLIVLAVLTAVIVVVMWPLRHAQLQRSGGSGPGAGISAAAENGDGRATAGDLAELEAAREAKYREIRDAELDHRTGKLSDADYELLDSALRAEAVEILHELDRARARVRQG